MTYLYDAFRNRAESGTGKLTQQAAGSVAEFVQNRWTAGAAVTNACNGQMQLPAAGGAVQYDCAGNQTALS